jgi:hypothetical protein
MLPLLTIENSFLGDITGFLLLFGDFVSSSSSLLLYSSSSGSTESKSWVT